MNNEQNNAPTVQWPWPWLQSLGELVSAAKNRDASRSDQEAAINAAHADLFNILRTLQPTTDRVAPAVPQAMAIVTDALRADPDYAWSWHCNVAMSALDEGLDHYRANKAAARFMSLLAGVDTSKHPGFPDATDATDATLKESINDRSERQFMERMASNHEMLTAFSQTIESFTHDYQLLYSTYKSYRDMLAGLIKERDSLRDQVAQPAQEAGLTDEVVNDAAKVLAERFDYPWEHMPEEGRKNMRVQARAVVEAALRAKVAV